MSSIFPSVDPHGLFEYSVVFTDRSLNHMSQEFQGTINDISTTLKKVYNANSVAIVPGSGTFGMEAVARQFSNQKRCLIIRNGWFSYRWTQILEMGQISASCNVMKARKLSEETDAPFIPAPIEEVVARIYEDKPDIVFAPHVETSSGIMLPDEYLKAMADAVHEVGGMLVVDCIASGTVWLDMKKVGIDVLISAPQKGWSASPGFGLIMLSSEARARIEDTTSTSFACDLKKWLQIVEAYEQGGHAYHATMPTDALVKFRDTMLETQQYGFNKIQDKQLELGTKIRSLLDERGIKSVAAKGFEAPGVVVSYTQDARIQNGSKFLDKGLQIAAGVPLQCDEPDDYCTFRIGLFGLDKLQNVDRTVSTLSATLDKVIQAK